MMDKPLYNSIIIKNYLEYLKSDYPGVNTRELLDYAGITEYEVEDRGHWLTQTQVNRFHEYMSRITGYAGIARQAGRFVSSPKTTAFTILRKSVAGFLSPAMAYWAMEKLSSTVTRHSTVDSRILASNKIELTVKVHAGIKEKPFQCENRIGSFEAVSEMFTGKYANIEHPECMHKGDAHCRYIVSWESPRSVIWQRIGSYTLAASILAAFPLFFFFPMKEWLIVLLSSTLLSTGILFASALLRNREMASNLVQQGKASEDVIEQINLRYNESLLIREISEAAASIFDSKELLNFITDKLHKRLMFERSMVMLANPEKTKLIYSAGHGFTPHEEALLRHISFTLTNPNSRTYFYQAYVHQKPIIVDSSELSEPNLSERNYHLVRDLGITSFICVPIVYKRKTEGILAIDISKMHIRPTQSNVSLLVGVAQQIAISLNNVLAHKKILESEERFRNLSENAPDIIYQLDPAGRIRYINHAWMEVLGHQSANVTGKWLGDFLRQEDHAAFQVMLREIIEDQAKIRDKFLTIFNVKGLPRHITLSAAPDKDAEGHTIGIVGTIKDITKIRNMEAQLLQASKMEAVGTLTGGIAHDFNNIIQAIMGYNQLMISGRLGNEEDISYLNSIGELISRSRELVRQLLLFSKKVEPFSRIVNINEEIKSVHSLLSRSIPKMIEIRTDLYPDILPISADSTQIGQIIMNLVINARDAMGESGIINIKTENLVVREKTTMGNQEIKPGAYIHLCVEDTGCGMDEDMLKRIFEPFFTTKEPGQGTGLGLAVVSGIVKNHEGYIFCESRVDEGTTFHIILPASVGTLPDKIETAPVETTYGTERILLVDDEKSILETVKDTLRLYGYRVVTAGSGEEALEIYRAEQNNFDLVILDLIMPGGGGKKCLRDLLEFNPAVRVLISSGYSNGQQTDDMSSSGAAGFIHKPYQPEDLLASIRRILDAGR